MNGSSVVIVCATYFSTGSVHAGSVLGHFRYSYYTVDLSIHEDPKKLAATEERVESTVKWDHERWEKAT